MKSLVFLLLVLAPFSGYGQSNQICVGELKYPKGDASGGRNFSDDTIFTISVGNSKIEIGKGDSKILELPESVKGKYISIKKNGKAYSSIKYNPKKFEKVKACLWLYWPHATWQLDKYEQGKHGCKCF